MKRWTMCLLLGLLLLLGSCSTAAEKGGYQLYFASGLEDGSAILSEPYQGEADPGPRELMEALLSVPTEEELNSPFPSGVSLRSWGLEEGVLVLNLSEQYGGLTDISLTVADYCIVLTMSQLDGVGGSGDQCGRTAGELPEPPDPDSRGGGALPAEAGAGGPE